MKSMSSKISSFFFGPKMNVINLKNFDNSATIRSDFEHKFD